MTTKLPATGKHIVNFVLSSLYLHHALPRSSLLSFHFQGNITYHLLVGHKDFSVKIFVSYAVIFEHEDLTHAVNCYLSMKPSFKFYFPINFFISYFISISKFYHCNNYYSNVLQKNYIMQNPKSPKKNPSQENKTQRAKGQRKKKMLFILKGKAHNSAK